MAEAKVRDCDTARIITCSDDDHHVVGQSSDSTPRLIDSGNNLLVLPKNFVELSHKSSLAYEYLINRLGLLICVM